MVENSKEVALFVTKRERIDILDKLTGVRDLIAGDLDLVTNTVLQPDPSNLLNELDAINYLISLFE